MPRRQEKSYEATETDIMDDEDEAWPVDQSIPVNVDPTQKKHKHFILEQKSGATLSSYWSVSEQRDFHKNLLHFGTDWLSIAETMKTKTHIMVRNAMSDEVTDDTDVFFRSRTSIIEGSRKARPASSSRYAARADKTRAQGADMGPMPNPTATGEWGRYTYRSSELQPINSRPRFRQVPPKFPIWEPYHNPFRGTEVLSSKHPGRRIRQAFNRDAARADLRAKEADMGSMPTRTPANGHIYSA